MEASYEGGQGLEGAVAPYMDGRMIIYVHTSARNAAVTLVKFSRNSNFLGRFST